MNAAYPYRLRLEHEGWAGLKLDRPGRRIRIDPALPVESDDIVILTAPYPERLREIRKAAVTPDIVASADLLTALNGVVTHKPHPGSTALDGVTIELFPYAPPPITATDLLSKAQGAFTRPVRTLTRVLDRIREPEAEPQILFLTFPDESRLVHLNLSLHQDTDEPWLRAVQQRSAGAEWLLVDVPYGESDAVLKHLAGFDVQRIIFTDFTAEIRRELGRPPQLLTPTVDQAVAQGMEGYVCVSQASFRFE
ncbi:MAG: hypothetical protein AAFV53_20220 [Myxococcota bacterium]